MLMAALRRGSRSSWAAGRRSRIEGVLVKREAISGMNIFEHSVNVLAIR